MGTMNVLDLVASLTLDTSSYDNALAQARNSASLSGSGIARNLAGASRIIGGAIVGEAAIAVKAFSNYESAFAGAMKTISFEEGTTKEEMNQFFDDLYVGILNMSRVMPQTAEEIAGVAETAGQLGVSNEYLLDFVEVATMLGSATNLSASEAANALARFANVTGMAESDYAKLGASIVELGNNTATTESEIVYFMQNLSVLGNMAGFSESEIAALSATMSATGARAESTRSTFETLATEINKAVGSLKIENGEIVRANDELYLFAKASGMTAQQFAEVWRADPMSALIAFATGLDQMDYSINQQRNLLEGVGIDQVRYVNNILRLAGAHELLAESVDMANESYKEMGETEEEYNALQIEYMKRNETLESQWSMFKNSLKEVAINVGEALVPALKNLLEALTPIINQVADFIKAHPDFVKRIAEIGLALVGFGTAESGIERVVTLLAQFSSNTALAVMGVIALVAVLGTLAMMYRGELGNFFSQIGLFIDNVQLGIEQVRLFLENADWGAVGGFIGTELLLGIVGFLNAGSGMISDALNNVISQIDLPFFNGAEWISSLKGGKGIQLPKIDTTELEEYAELYKEQMLDGNGTYEAVRKEMDKLNLKKDANAKKMREGSWWGTGDNRSFEQRAAEARKELVTNAFNWLGLGDLVEGENSILPWLTNLKPIPEEVTESYENYGDGVEKVYKAFTGGEEETGELPEVLETVPEAIENVTSAAENATGSFSGLSSGMDSAKDAGNELLGESGNVAGAISEVGGAAGSAAGSLDQYARALREASEQMKMFPVIVNGDNSYLVPGGVPQIPGRASGGGVNANEPYWVGEKGIELYVPERSGTIVSNDDLKSRFGQTINFHVHFEGDVIGDEKSIYGLVNRAAKAAIRQEVRAAA